MKKEMFTEKFVGKVAILLAVLLLWPLSESRAFTKVRVNDIEVTSSNANDVLGNGGKVKFYAASNELVLNNAKLEYIDAKSDEDLKIVLKGKNNTIAADWCGIFFEGLYSQDENGVRFYPTLYIEGGDEDATLTISSRSSGLFAYLSNLTISNCKVIIKAEWGALDGKPGGDGDGILTIQNGATVDVRSNRNAIGNVVQLVLGDGISILSPEGAWIDRGPDGWSFTRLLVNGVDVKHAVFGPGDAKPEEVIVPVTEKTEVSFSVEQFNVEEGEEPDLNGVVIDNVYISIGSEDGGFDVTDNSIVINKTTSYEELLEAIYSVPGEEELDNNYTGLVVRVPAGTGTVKVDYTAVGTSQVAVQVGYDEPTVAQQSDSEVTVDYEVTEETYVYIYAVEGDGEAGAKAQIPDLRGAARRAAAVGENAVKIKGVKVTPTEIVTGIETVETTVESDSADWYTIDGRKLGKRPKQKGVYVKGRHKYVVE